MELIIHFKGLPDGMDLDGLNLDDPSFLTAGADPKETLQDLDTLSNGDLGEDPIA